MGRNWVTFIELQGEDFWSMCRNPYIAHPRDGALEEIGPLLLNFRDKIFGPYVVGILIYISV